MSGSKFPETAVEVSSTKPATLKQRIDDGRSVTLLDTREPDDFANWHIDGPGVETVNVPYTDFLDGVDEAAVESHATLETFENLNTVEEFEAAAERLSTEQQCRTDSDYCE